MNPNARYLPSDAVQREVVPLNWCVTAMQRAFERARSTGWDDVIGEYAAVAETLYWVHVLHTQLRQKHGRHYDAALDSQPADLRRMLDGLLWVRHRITHEVDQVWYLQGTATSSENFVAEWTWCSLPPRPEVPPSRQQKDARGYTAYKSAVAGRDAVKVLLSVVNCLGQAAARMSTAYDQDHPSV